MTLWRDAFDAVENYVLPRVRSRRQPRLEDAVTGDLYA